MKKKKAKVNKVKRDEYRGVKRLLYVLFGLIAIICLYLLFIYPQTLKIETFVDNPKSEETETLEGLARFLDTKVTASDYGYSDWIEESGVRVPLTGKQILLGTSTTSDNVGKYGNFTTDELEKVNPEFLTPLQDRMAEYFESNGFTQNELNTNLVPNELYFSTLGYEKGNLYCLAHLAQMSDPFGYISCGMVNQKQLEMQNELINVLTEQSQEGWMLPVTFRVDKMDGDFANGSISSTSGYQWIAKKIDGVWTTVWTGQDYPLCSDMKLYEIPPSMYPGCYNPKTQEVQKTY